MKIEELNDFIELYEQIAALKAVKCRLTHERVRTDRQTFLPIPEQLPELGYVRVGFCPDSERKKRLACGHTMARYLLEKALGLLDSETALKTELGELTDKIHSLDHQKGDAEKQLAGLVEKKHLQKPPEENLEKDLAAAVARIKEIERRHSDCAERIGQLQHKILAQMKTVIRREQNLGRGENSGKF